MQLTNHSVRGLALLVVGLGAQIVLDVDGRTHLEADLGVPITTGEDLGVP